MARNNTTQCVHEKVTCVMARLLHVMDLVPVFAHRLGCYGYQPMFRENHARAALERKATVVISM